MKPRTIPSIPPGAPRSAFCHIPPRHAEDVAQEAWLAYLAGDDPKAAVWRHAKRATRRERRFVSFSQIPRSWIDRIYNAETNVIGHDPKGG